MKTFFFAFLLSLPGISFAQNSYWTNFPATENPISQNGRWITGYAAGLDWNDVQTSAGKVYGVNNQLGNYNDPVAVLTGIWATTQSATATISLGSSTAFSYPEVELRLNVAVSAHSVTGYEFSCSVLNHAKPAGCFIVRWNGPVNNFTYLAMDFDESFEAPDGAMMTAVNTGAATHNLLFYVNGVLRASATDHTFTAGSPGIGFNAPDGGKGNHAVYSNFAFSSFFATDDPNSPMQYLAKSHRRSKPPHSR